MTKFENILDKDMIDLWNNYENCLDKGLKKKAIETLNVFILRLKATDIETQRKITNILIDRKEEENFLIQFPLFKDMVLPILIQNAKQGKLGAYRLIGEFEQFIYSDSRLGQLINRELNIGNDSFYSIGMFEKELSINPRDTKTINLLIQGIAKSLDYAVHEVPIGVLYDKELYFQRLEQLEKLLVANNLMSNKWDKRISTLNSIGKTWTDYLESKGFENYADFLVKSENADADTVLKYAENNYLLYDVD
jgi:hypothetical protein